MQLCKIPVYSYGRYKQAVRLYGGSTPTEIFQEEVVEPTAEFIGDTLEAIGSAAYDAAEALLTTGLTVSQGRHPDGSEETTVIRVQMGPTITSTRPDTTHAGPDSMVATMPMAGIQFLGGGVTIEKRVAIPVVPEDAPETDTDDEEKKKSTTGD